MAVDFERELVRIADTVVPPDCEISPQAIVIGTEALYEIDAKYGPDSPNPKPFHNASHSLGMTRRLVRLTNMLYPFIKPEYQEGIYDLDLVGGPSHDWEQMLGPDANERASSDNSIERVEAQGGPLNTDRFKERLDLGIMATAVRVEPGGELVQARLQTGEADPFKFIMGFGDINGIAMEGPKRMMRDATNLYYEITPEPTIDGLFKFLIDQELFLSRRLNDRRVKADIAYHFPDEIEAVYGVMRQAFHRNIVAAHSLAVLFGRTPELKVPIEAALKGVDVVDRALPGDIISKVIRKYVTI